MEWIKQKTGTNPLYSERMFALRPHEAKVMASAFEKPLKEFKAELCDLDTVIMRGEETSREQDYRHLLLEEAIDVISEFIEHVTNGQYEMD